MCYYLGILVLTVFCICHVQSECFKEASRKILNDIEQSVSTMSKDAQYVHFYQVMKRDQIDFEKNLFDCDDSSQLFDAWDKLQKNLLNNITKLCLDFESSYGEVELCRRKLDVYHFHKDQKKYCSNLEICSAKHGRMCAPLKELVLLNNHLSNASVNFCTIECDDIPTLKKILSNCWASVQTVGLSTSQHFELFSDCVMAATKPTCRMTKNFVYRIFPLFHNKAQEIISGTVSEKPESKCIHDWKVLKDTEDLNPSMCQMLEDMKTCITKSLKGDDKRYKEKLAKCQYSVVNLIKTEAPHQTIRKPTPAPSTAAGKFGSGIYHLAVICWLVTMVTYFDKII